MNTNERSTRGTRQQSRILRSDHVYGAYGHHYGQFVYSMDFFDLNTTVGPVENPWPLHDPLTDENLKKRDKICRMNWSNRMFRVHMKKSCKDILRFKIKPNNVNLRDNGIIRISNNVIQSCRDWHLEFPFGSKWNPYLTGNLDVLEIDGTRYLIRPNHRFRLLLTPMTYSAETFRIINPESVNHRPIYGLQTLPTDNNIILKHWNSLSIAHVTTLNNPWELKHHQLFDEPILNVNHNNGIGTALLFSVVNRSAKCKIWHPESGCLTNFAGIESASGARFFNSYTLGSVWKHKLQAFDLRETTTVPTKELTTDSIKAPACDQLLDFHLLNDNLLYMMSTHYLYKVDLRNLKTLKYCSHQVRFPSMLSVQDSHVVVSDQSMAHRSTLFAGSELEVNSTPFELPTVLRSLRKCQLKGSKRPALWGRRFSLEDRLTPSLCGVKLLRTSEGAHVLYMSNVAGEVFVQNVDRRTISNTRAAKRLYEWVVNLKEADVQMHATAVVNMKKLQKEFVEATRKNIPSQRQERINFDVRADPNFQYYTLNRNMSQIWRNILEVWDEPAPSSSLAQNNSKKRTAAAPYRPVMDWVVDTEGDEVEPLPDIDEMLN